ncbi:MAG: DUF4957 domain-containing protein [Muribaculaceae bacterium]|nr:DUF4957 domain-containing protein [Muribaculaceae bacterium]
MKKMTLKMRLLSGLVIVSMALAAGSCAQGADCDEVFSAGVTNTQLESPAVEDVQFNVGTGELSVSWPTMWGAGGYLVSATEITDPENPNVAMEETTIDGTSTSFAVEDDKRYLVSIKTLGNEKLNNTGAESATEIPYFVGVNGIEVPADTPDLGAFINEQLAANAEAWEAERKADFNFEIAFDLAPGVEYQFATAVDFGLFPDRIRSLFPDKPAFITYGNEAKLTTQAGLRLQNLRIDASLLSGNGLIELSSSPSDEIKDANLIYMGGTTMIGAKTYKELGANKSAYIIEKPIEFKNVWVKDLPKSTVYSNAAYGVTDLRFTNSIIQTANIGKPFIYLQKGNQHMKNFTIEQTTIYDSGTFKNFILALGNQNTTKVFGSVGSGGNWTVEESTFYLPNNDKKGGDRVRDVASANNLINSIFVNIRELAGGNGKLFSKPAVCTNNTVYHFNDSYKLPEYDADGGNIDPGFTAQPALDLHNVENGGINLTPTGNALTDRRGDPRWLPAVAAEE